MLPSETGVTISSPILKSIHRPDFFDVFPFYTVEPKHLYIPLLSSYLLCLETGSVVAASSQKPVPPLLRVHIRFRPLSSQIYAGRIICTTGDSIIMNLYVYDGLTPRKGSVEKMNGLI